MGYLFTSESVSEGHPDKVADQISDALLDEFLRFDPESKVACETLVTTGLTVCSGEVKTNGYVDVQKWPAKRSVRLDTLRPNTVLMPIPAESFQPYTNNHLISIRALNVKKKKIRVPAIRE